MNEKSAKHSPLRWSAGFIFVVLASALSGAPLSAQVRNEAENQWIAFNRAGAGNSNLQCFKPSNVTVSEGNLVITTKAENANCSSIDLAPASYKYTSGFVSMRTFNFLYGTIEFRAKFGGGNRSGAWPVVWMNDASCQKTDPTGTDDPCNGQEIDIAEILDGDFSLVNQQIHINNFAYNDGCKASASDTSKNFHTYKLDWLPGILKFSIDGVTTCTISELYVPNAPMYLKMNVFTGNYGGPVNDRTLPWVTLVDYVTIKQNNRVVFHDDFDSATTIQPAQYTVTTPPVSPSWFRRAFSKAVAHWRTTILILFLAIISLFSSLRFRRSSSSERVVG